MNVDRPQKRVRINRPYPTHTLEDVLPIARAIQDDNSGLPMDRELLASTLGTTPFSSGFRMKLTSSAKYGLTTGGYNDERISLTILGQQCVAPQNPGEARTSLVKSASEPDIFRDFYRLLDRKLMPEELYAKNMLMRELSVHADLASQCLATIISNGLFAGILRPDGQKLMVAFTEESSTGEIPVAAHEKPQPASVADIQRPDVVTPDEASTANLSIFVGIIQPSENVNRIVDILSRLGLNIVQNDASAESPSVTLSAGITKAMQNCVAGIVFAPSFRSGDDTPSGVIERATWLFIGAAKFQYGENVVLVETSSGTSSRSELGIRTVAINPNNQEAAALGILTALIEVGAVKIAL